MGTHTPCGTAQNSEKRAPGIMWYSTSSHGGFHLSDRRNAQVPDYMRRDGGWYEEDSDWSIVATVFPVLFTVPERARAEETLRNWLPDEYERFTGKTIQPGQSYIRDERLFAEAHRNDYLVLSAWGDRHESVPPGMVGLFVGRGGRLPSGHYPADCKYFLVPAGEYRQPDRFVVDPARHAEIAPIH